MHRHLIVTVVVLGLGLGTAMGEAMPAATAASGATAVTVLCDQVGELQVEVTGTPSSGGTVRVIGRPAVRLTGEPGFTGMTARGRPVDVAPTGEGVRCVAESPTRAAWSGVLTSARARTVPIDPSTSVTGSLVYTASIDSDAILATASQSLATQPTATGIPGDPAGYGSVQAFPYAAQLGSYFGTRSGDITAAYRPVGSTVIYVGGRGSALNVTASIVKVQIMATVMRKAQEANRALTTWETSQLVPMIRYSDNTAATNLWNYVGRGPAVARVDALMGLKSTVMDPGGAWGLTVTNAPDQVVLVDHFSRTNPVLTTAMRSYGLSLMHSVTSSQAWGVTSGPPPGSTAVKNGWLPLTNGWHVNSIGAVSSGARSYSIAVLTHSTTASMSTQIATIAGTSSIVWGHTITGTVQLVADISGYYLAGTPTTPGAYAPLAPARVLDTRYGIGAPKVEVAPGGTVHLQVTGRGGVPTSGVSAVALNVTVTTPTRSGWITAYPDGAAKPTASNLNYTRGQTIPNLVIANVGADGRIALTNNSTGTVQLVADISGYYLAGTPTTPGAYAPLAPARVLDTRYGIGAPKVEVAPGGTVHLQVTGRGGVPTSGVSAVALNVTVTTPTRSGWITAYPDGAAKPTASNLNYTRGQTIPNLVIANVGADGRIALTNNSTGTVQLVADISGYYLAGTPTTPGAYVPLTPTRLMDTRTNLGGPGPVAAHGTVHLQVAGKGGAPASRVSAVVVNVTVTGPTAAGNITVYPDGTTMPTASNLNFTTGQTIPNLVIAKLGTDGRIALTNNS